MTVHPYISTLDQWMNNGTLHDPVKELFIQWLVKLILNIENIYNFLIFIFSNSECVMEGSNYWRDCYHSSDPPLSFKDVSHQVSSTVYTHVHVSRTRNRLKICNEIHVAHCTDLLQTTYM